MHARLRPGGRRPESGPGALLRGRFDDLRRRRVRPQLRVGRHRRGRDTEPTTGGRTFGRLTARPGPHGGRQPGRVCRAGPSERLGPNLVKVSVRLGPRDRIPSGATVRLRSGLPASRQTKGNHRARNLGGLDRRECGLPRGVREFRNARWDFDPLRVDRLGPRRSPSALPPVEQDGSDLRSSGRIKLPLIANEARRPPDLGARPPAPCRLRRPAPLPPCPEAA